MKKEIDKNGKSYFVFSSSNRIYLHSVFILFVAVYFNIYKQYMLFFVFFVLSVIVFFIAYFKQKSSVVELHEDYVKHNNCVIQYAKYKSCEIEIIITPNNQGMIGGVLYYFNKTHHLQIQDKTNKKVLLRAEFVKNADTLQTMLVDYWKKHI